MRKNVQMKYTSNKPNNEQQDVYSDANNRDVFFRRRSVFSISCISPGYRSFRAYCVAMPTEFTALYQHGGISAASDNGLIWTVSLRRIRSLWNFYTICLPSPYANPSMKTEPLQRVLVFIIQGFLFALPELFFSCLDTQWPQKQPTPAYQPNQLSGCAIVARTRAYFVKR